MYHYGKINLPKLHKKYPKYKNDLCGQYINSIRGYVIFNPISRFSVNLLGLIIENYWLTRYLVSSVKGQCRLRISLSVNTSEMEHIFPKEDILEGEEEV